MGMGVGDRANKGENTTSELPRLAGACVASSRPIVWPPRQMGKDQNMPRLVLKFWSVL